MKLGELADLLCKLDMLTESYIDQKDWIGRFEARGVTVKIEEQRLRAEEIKQQIMTLRDKRIGGESVLKRPDPFVDSSTRILDMSGDTELCEWWETREIPIDPRNCSQSDVDQARRLMQLDRDLYALHRYPPMPRKKG